MYGVKVAMRYYRLWIYTCNTVLFLSVVVFLGTASYIFFDNRRYLLPSVKLYHPTFIYAYLALIVQGGVVQTIGFLGAIRLNQRLLNSYYLLLLFLLMGDVLVGGYWLFRYERISNGLRGDLQRRFDHEYKDRESEFRILWDGVQSGSRCCGLHSPLDYNSSWWQNEIFLSLDEDEHFDKGEDILLPWSCCSPDESEALREKPSAMANTIRGRLMAKSNDDEEEEDEDAKDDDNEATEPPETQEEAEKPDGERDKKRINKNKHLIEEMIEEGPIIEPLTWCRYSGDYGAKWHYHRGCYEPLKHWLDTSADALFVIGFCVIGFLKFTFLGLLKVEIKEMIQKIKLLEEAEDEECGGGMQQHQQDMGVEQQQQQQQRNKATSPSSSSSSSRSQPKAATQTVVVRQQQQMNHVFRLKGNDPETSSCSALLPSSQQSTPAHQNHNCAAKNNVFPPPPKKEECHELTDLCKTSVVYGGGVRGLQTAI